MSAGETPTAFPALLPARAVPRPTRGAEPAQLDLFPASGVVSAAPAPASALIAAPSPESLSDACLLAAIPDAGRSSCHALAAEAARRRLAAAIPALETLCRRFKGFGLHRAVPEQVAALQAIAAIGGGEAVAALRRILTQDVVSGPGLSEAVRAAAALRCILPEPLATGLLSHPDPATRASACRCAPRSDASATMLVSLLADLNPGVATEAAKALARMGRRDGRAWLLRSLARQADAELIAAIAAIADDEATVLLGRLARAQPALRDAALDALETIDTPRAAAVLTALGQAGVTATSG